MASNGTVAVFLLPGEELRHTQENVRCFHKGTELASGGTLHITTRKIHWVPASHDAEPYTCTFPQIIVHATSKDTSSFPHPCIYCHIDTPDDSVEEVQFVPQRVDDLDTLFKIFSECSALNPDVDMDNASDDDAYFDREEAMANLIVNNMQNNDGDQDMYEDAVEDPQLSPKRRKTEDGN